MQQKHVTSPKLGSRLETRTTSKGGYGMGSRDQGSHRSEYGDLAGSCSGREGKSQVAVGERSWVPAEERSRESARVPVICIDSGDSDGSVLEATPAAQLEDNHHRSKGKKKKKTSHHQKDEFSRALEMPVKLSRVLGRSGQKLRQEMHPLCADSRQPREFEEEDVLITGTSAAPASLVRGENGRAAAMVTPGPHGQASGAGRKRKGACGKVFVRVWMDLVPLVAEPQQEVGIGHTKRSRTQVYSGKRAAQTGPQG